jgi:hypothetical protein
VGDTHTQTIESKRRAMEVAKTMTGLVNGMLFTLLEKVAKDYSLPLEELKEKYLGEDIEVPKEIKKVKKPREPKETADKKMCTGLTAKGQPCKFAAVDGGCLCGIHLRKESGEPRKPKEPKEPKEPKKVKKVKTVPEHNHKPEEPSETCELCESHGDGLKPELTKADFEAVEEEGKSIQDRLRAILAEAEEDPEDDEEVSAEAEEVANALKVLSMEDEEEYTEEDMDQLTESPHSRERFEKAKKSTAFEELLEEETDDEEED